MNIEIEFIRDVLCQNCSIYAVAADPSDVEGRLFNRGARLVFAATGHHRVVCLRCMRGIISKRVQRRKKQCFMILERMALPSDLITDIVSYRPVLLRSSFGDHELINLDN